MPFKFNETLWKLGQKIEDDTLPLINKHYECDFKRNENDIFDILDFKDDDKKRLLKLKEEEFHQHNIRIQLLQHQKSQRDS